MTYEFITVSTEQQLATISLNRPDKRNAMHGPMIAELIEAMKQLAKQEDVIALAIRGNGEHFCAGADINWMKQISAGSYEQNYDDAQYIADLMYTLYNFPKPTVAIVHGAAMGGGLGVIAACDIAIASDNAAFAFSEVKIGIAPSTISPYIVAAIGERAAHYYFLTGEKFNATTAQQIGLIHQVVINDELTDAAKKITDTLCNNSPHAMKEIKQLLRGIAKEKISEALSQKTAEHLANMRVSPQAKEGLLAFNEKRAPVWK